MPDTVLWYEPRSYVWLVTTKSSCPSGIGWDESPSACLQYVAVHVGFVCSGCMQVLTEPDPSLRTHLAVWSCACFIPACEGNSSLVTPLPNPHDTLALQDLSVEAFVSCYESPRVPVVLTGLTDGWPAQQEWTPRKLLEQYREHRFKVGGAGGASKCRLAQVQGGL